MKKYTKNQLEDIYELKKTIYYTKKMWDSEYFEIGLRCISAYIKNAKVFSIDNQIALDIKNIWMEYKNIKKVENRILHYLSKKAYSIDYSSFPAEEFILDLDELSNQTSDYYESALEDIEIACDMQQEYRAKRMPRKFDTIIEDQSLVEELIGNTITEKDIARFLKLPRKFIKFMKKDSFRIYQLENDNEEHQAFYGVNCKTDKQENIIDIKLIVPIIVDLETALINISEYQKAYELYQRLGTKLEEEEQITDSANQVKSGFEKKYGQLKTSLYI